MKKYEKTQKKYDEFIEDLSKNDSVGLALERGILMGYDCEQPGENTVAFDMSDWDLEEVLIGPFVFADDDYYRWFIHVTPQLRKSFEAAFTREARAGWEAAWSEDFMTKSTKKLIHAWVKEELKKPINWEQLYSELEKKHTR